MGKNTREKRKSRKKKRHGKHLCFFAVTLLFVVGTLFGIKLMKDRTVPVISGWFSTEEYPESLVAFAKKYPQAEEFVRNYPKKKDLHRPIDLSGEVTKGEVPLFLQWDERWGYEWYGDDFLGVNGCGPTTLSMVYCGLTGDSCWNPYEVAKMADKSGYYVSGVGSSWDLMSAGAQKLGLTVHEVGYGEAEILNALGSGLTLICSMGPGDFTYTGHFVALTGIDSDGKIIVRDCNSPANSGKTWDISELMPQIAGVWGYSYENV
ncbi:MAG: C39 family peptidase [Marvinbryantia sp.]|jgi:hypothetical protein